MENEVSQDEIARCAYQIWESAGRPEGCAMQHWFQAEAQIRTRSSSAASAQDQSKAARSRKPAARRASGTKGEKRFEMIT